MYQIYTPLVADGTKLSIDALPESPDSLCSIPLGLKTNIDGNIVFRIIDIIGGASLV